MKVKKYIVDSMPEALQKIRVELGKDAVIINTKEIRIGGFLGMFAKKKIEVVAATDSHPESAPAVRAGASSVSHAAAAAQPPPRRAPAKEAPRPAGAAAVLASAPASASVPVGESESALRGATSSSLPPPSLSSTTAYRAAAVPPGPSVRDEALLHEMKQMKEMMQRLSAVAGQDPASLAPSLPPAFAAIRTRLIEQDVLERHADALIQAAMESISEGQPAEASAKEALDAVKRALVEWLTRRPIQTIRPDARLVHFVGPTGVGKTTTIAKLAAEQTLKARRSIGLITSDTYRIAAIEQLRTYASILNVPLEVVFSSLDLRKALDKLQDREMILMDTAGRNFRNEMAVSELQSLLRSEERKDTFLVLSLSMKYSDMRAVAENFCRFGVEKVLFTKADETATLGAVVNLLHDFPLSLSYVTDGQNVPDDIRAADAAGLADEIVGEPHEE